MTRSKLPLPEMGADIARPRFQRAPRASGKKPDLRVVLNAAEDEAKIYIYDEIGWFGVTPQMVAEQLKDISAGKIALHVNSPGGDVFAGVAIYNIIARHPAYVTTHVDGVAASAASIIALAGDEVEMAEGSFAMIHSAWSFVAGNARELRKVAELLDKVDGSLADIYARQMDMTRDEAMALMEAETWLSADEAVEKGFADRVEERAAVEAAFDFSVFQNTPDRLAAARGSARGSASKPQTVRELEAVLRDAGYSRSEATRIAASGFDTTAPARDEPAVLDLSPLADLAAAFRSHSQR